MTLIAAALFVLATAAAPPKDVYFEQTVVSSSGGRPTGPGVSSRVWHAAGGRMRLQAGGEDGAALILRLEEGKGWRLDPERKTATVLDVERLRERSRMDLGLAGQLMGADEPPRVAEIPEPRLVAGYRCRGYRLRAGTAVIELYLTRELPLGMEAFAGFLEWSGAAEALGPLLKEMRALRGFPLQTRSRVTLMGEVHETVSTVTRVQIGPSQPALFEPPPGYRLRAEPPAAGE